MTNEPNEYDSPQAGLADPELEQLLGEVYDTPPIPKSLLKRIDRGVENEWGDSPELVSSPTVALTRSFATTRQWLAAVPVAACVVMAVGWFALFGSGVCAWSSVLDAIAKQGVLEISEPDGVRWLSLATGVSGQQSESRSTFVDTRRKFTLTRLSGENSITRYRQKGRSKPTNSELLVSFLAGSPMEDQPDRWAGLRVVSESAELFTRGGVERYRLQVKFRTESEALEMDLTVDPATLLPSACEVKSDLNDVSNFDLKFTSVSMDELRDRHFPSDIQIVDVDRPSAKMIAADRSASKLRDSLSMNDGVGETAPIKAELSSVGLLKAATTWKAVHVVRRTPGETLQRVDSVLKALWEDKGIQPAQAASDDELMRRVYLDLAGRTPSVSEIRAYNKAPADTRYEALVERLLASPDHASHLATVYRSFLIPEGVDLTVFGGVEAFDKWLAKRFENNEPYDEVVRALLLSEGRLSRSGPLLFYSATKLDPDQLAARTSRVFLGMRLECAQCHDHPFEPWTQEDFWSLAAFFARISRPQGELETASTVMRVHDVDRGEVTLPETETVVPPRFLDGTPFDDNQADARRSELARWLTSAKNPYFARAAANRVWGQMFGMGIVNPIDDFGELNPPVSPELLDTLASRLIDTNFDLRDLFRVVALSSAYRISSGADEIDPARLETFAQMNVKTLTAEQVYDCITVASMLEAPAAGGSMLFNVSRFGNTSREEFLQQFRTPSQDRTSFQAGIPQALTLMNGALIEGATGLSSSGLLKSLETPFFTNRQRVDVLYMATLSRQPNDSERKLLDGYLPSDATKQELRQSMADLLWVLLNSAEFTLNH